MLEQRAHPRVAAPVRAELIHGPLPRTALAVRDISEGGLFLLSGEPLADLDDVLTLELSMPNGALAVTLKARVVRESRRQDGTFIGNALQFVEISPQQGAGLAALIVALLNGPGGDRRAHPRVAQRVEVICSGSSDVQGVLRDISLGGAGLWVDTPLAVGEKVTLKLSRPPEPALQVPAKVIATFWGSPDDPFDRAGVQFDPLDEQARSQLKDFINGLLH